MKKHFILFFLFTAVAASASPLFASEILNDYKTAKKHTLNLKQTPYTGASQPKIEIVLYSDFYCSHCKEFLNSMEEILAKPEFKNKVRLYYKVFPIYHPTCSAKKPLDDWSSSCKVGLVFFELFLNGPFWQFEKNTRENKLEDPDKIIQAANQYLKKPVNYAQLKDKNQHLLFQHIKEGISLGINATPTWFINGRIMTGAYPAEDLMVLINSILKGSK